MNEKYYKKRRSMIKFKLSKDILKFQTIKETQNNLLNIYSYNSNIYLNKKQEWEHVGYFQAKFNLFFIKLWGINLIDYENSNNIIKLNNFIPLLSIHTPNKRDIKWGRETKNTMDILKEHNLQNFNSTNNKFRVAILKGFKILLSDGDSNNRLNTVYKYIQESEKDYFVNIQAIYDYNFLLKNIKFKKNKILLKNLKIDYEEHKINIFFEDPIMMLENIRKYIPYLFTILFNLIQNGDWKI